ncbi:MAG: MBOAT family protein [Kiritimatiellae bacterium]|nr:MBOAT family protein [Kiritimatiellia bacterium]
MLFNSFEFIVFLPLVFAAYWLLSQWPRLQNLLVIVASYLFYGWWDWRFLLLITFTSAWSYVAGLVELQRWGRKPSRFVLASSLIVNLGILGVFKYYNFFADQFAVVLAQFGFKAHMPSLSIILPVGISFYTFQALSYTIDVYRRQLIPSRDPLAFFAFISFFPQLVAGPIERAANLLPQFLSSRRFDYAQAVLGCRQMLWGFFKKMVVADNCAAVADHFLNMDGQTNGAAIWIGVFMFALQIYGDFSGYSDIAIGCSRLFGINLKRNFAFPYFSRDIAEFWRRWHVSLTTWFRDYLYIPLGGSRCSKWKQIRNTFAIFLVSGLWHGANWTFVIWGAFHALLFLPLLLMGRNRKYLSVAAEDRALPGIVDLGRMALTFFMATIGWAIFRARSASECFSWLVNMATPWRFASVGKMPREFGVALASILIVLAVEWFNRRSQFGFERLPAKKWMRRGLYYAVLTAITCGAPGSETFVYFQF